MFYMPCSFLQTSEDELKRITEKTTHWINHMRSIHSSEQEIRDYATAQMLQRFKMILNQRLYLCSNYDAIKQETALSA